jgi:hypothetical protein
VAEEAPLTIEQEPPLQFGIRGLMVLQAVCAVFFAGLVWVGAAALLIALVVTVVYAAMAVAPAQRPAKRLIVDLAGGIVFPCLCVYYDPGFFRGVRNLGGLPHASLAVAAMGMQMVALLLWLAVGRRAGVAAALFSGVFMGGTALAMLIGLALLPASVIGIFLWAGYGGLGLTPFLTAVVFGRNSARAWRVAVPRGDLLPMLLLWLGLAVAVAVPVALYFFLGDEIAAALDRLPRPEPLVPMAPNPKV